MSLNIFLILFTSQITDILEKHNNIIDKQYSKYNDQKEITKKSNKNDNNME